MNRAEARGGPDGKVVITLSFGPDDVEVYEFTDRRYVAVSDRAARRLERIGALEVRGNEGSS